MDDATDTAYVFTVSGDVVDDRHADLQCHRSVGHAPTCTTVFMPTVFVGTAPIDMAVDDATDTAYVASHGNHEVAMIDTSTCNATVQSGCSNVPAVDVG